MLTLRSERIVLRKLRADDATPAYASWLDDPDVNRFLEVRHYAHTVESCRQFIAQMNDGDTQHLFGIFLAASERHIGNIKIGFVDPRYATAQASLFIGDKSMWGQGFGPEAIRLATTYGFVDLGLARIEAGVYEENLSSLKAFLKVGYTVEGFFRKKFVLEGRRVGSFCMGVLRDEWQFGRK